MKGLLKRLPKKAMILIALFTFVLVIGGYALVTKADFGPERRTFTMANPAPYVTFNSITDNPVAGDERYFLTGALPGTGRWSDPVRGAQDGQEITLRIFVHNDAAANLHLNARDTRVRVQIPGGSRQNQQIIAYVNADNSRPRSVWDTLDVSGANNGFFELQYVPGSARLTNNHFTNGVRLPDSIVGENGAQVGYSSLNGVVPGCAQFSGWVTLRVKVNMPRYTIRKLVRLPGEGADRWRESVNTKVNSRVEWDIEVRNAGSTTLNNIIVLDQVPRYMSVVPGSVRMYNANHPTTPYVYPDSAIQQRDGRYFVNVNAGDYKPNSNLHLRFDTQVVDDGSLACGNSRLTNQAFATPGGYGSVSSYAYVVINKVCEQASYSCDALNIGYPGGTRTISAQVDYTTQNGAVYRDVNINFGDGSAPYVSNNNSTTHTFAQDGTYTISATVGFMLNGQRVTANGPQCTSVVRFENGTPVTPPENLPNTGPGSLLGLFAGSSILGTLGYRKWALRRQKR
jgi:uncharacterized repeat protein (TIGR01451 family)